MASNVLKKNCGTWGEKLLIFNDYGFYHNLLYLTKPSCIVASSFGFLCCAEFFNYLERSFLLGSILCLMYHFIFFGVDPRITLILVTSFTYWSLTIKFSKNSHIQFSEFSPLSLKQFFGRKRFVRRFSLVFCFSPATKPWCKS